MMAIVAVLDNLLNRITMYRLVLYCLMILSGVAVLAGSFHLLFYSGVALLASLALLVAVCVATNTVFARLWKAPATIESTFITAFILFLIMPPAQQLAGALPLILAGVVSIASKYIVVYRKQHLFNPAAFAAVILGITSLGGALWWVGSAVLLPAVLIAGLLIVRKIRRFALFFSAVIASTVVVLIVGAVYGTDLFDVLRQHFLSWPILFFASVMVTEPLTAPPTQRLRILYGILVGALSSIPFAIGPLYGSPELALVIGNAAFFAAGLRRRLILSFVEKKPLAGNTYELVFAHAAPVTFRPGQYLEWTVPHAHQDSRGARRYFTVASSPTEKNIAIGVKFSDNSSTFKKRLATLTPGETVAAAQIGGDFILPRDPRIKLLFIAGGIGITPFRSMIKYLLDRNERREVVLFYTASTPHDFAYQDFLKEAEERLDIQTVYIATHREAEEHWTGEVGHLTHEILTKYASDGAARRCYISGPQAMVTAYRKLLRSHGVPARRIVTDYFPGFA